MKVRPLEGGLDSWRERGFPMGGAARGETLNRKGAPFDAPATGGLAQGKEGTEEP